MEKIIQRMIDEENSHGAELKLYHYNCAELIVIAANEKYDLKLGDRAGNLVAGFGGGMFSGLACGALTGAIVVLSKMYKAERPTDDKQLKAKVRLMISMFRERFEDTECSVLKDRSNQVCDNCVDIKFETARILEEVINS